MTLSSNSDFAKLCLGIPHSIEHVSELLFDLTDPGEIKHKYRTSRGILAYLAGKMAYWTAKFGPSLEHHVM